MIFLVEAYGTGPTAADDELGRAVEAHDPNAIRHLATIPVPADEVVFRLFRSNSRDALITSLESAALPFARISEVDERVVAATLRDAPGALARATG